MRRIGLAVVVALSLALAPLAGEAQPPAKVARIGYLSPFSAAADLPQRQAFHQGLRDLGYVEGQNVVVEARYADGKYERLPALASEIVRLNVDVIVASPTPAIRAVKQATQTIPIVMAFGGDPVGEHFVAGLARPGGNITGHSAAVPEMAMKRLEFLKTIVPKLSSVSHLVNPGITRRAVTETEDAGRTLGIRVMTITVRDQEEINRAFLTIRKANVRGLIVALSLQDHWEQIINVALQHRLPAVSGPREFVELGGLFGYGPHYPDLFRRTASYVDKILKGTKPADLPVEQPTKFELVINLKTTKALGLTIPQSLLLRADQVIQ